MTNNKIRVLIVDDNSDDVYLIKELLKDITVTKRFELLHEKSLNSALELIEKENNENHKFDCILLNLNLPDSLGTYTLKNVLNKFPGLSVVILTIIDDEDVAIKSLQEGAQDYLVKGKISGEIISRSVLYAIERKKSENGLRDSERKYRDIVNTILEGLWITDEEGKTTYVNKRLAEMLGYTPGEILNKPFFDFVDKPLRDNAKQFFERRKKGVNDRYDFRFVKKDGSILWVIVSASPILNEKGKFAGAMGLLTDITEHKLTEQSLEKSAHEWDSTFNAITDIVCTIDSKGRMTHCNNAAKTLFKMSNEEIIGRTCWDVLNCPSERLKKCPIINMQKTHKRETLLLQINGKWFHSSVDPIVDNNSKVVGGVHIISDITKYKLAQNELRENEEKWRMLTENSPEYITTTDIDGNIQFVNRAISVTREQAIGTSIYSYIPDKFIQNIRDCFERVKQTKKPDKYYTEYIHPKDGILSFDAHVGPIIKSGEVIGFIISSSDITERKKVEDKLRESEESYRTIIEYSNDMIWTLNSEGNFLFFNKRTEKITGYMLSDWKDKNFSLLIIKEDLPKVIDTLRSTLNGQPNQYEATIKSKYGKNIIVSVNTAPIYSKGKIVGTVNFGRNITDNKKSEEKIKKAAEDLARSNKELAQFAYIASHDLQEPLRSISSFTELLARRYKNKLDIDADEFIGHILDGTKRMRQMIDDLLTLSRIGTRGKEFKPTNVTNILNDVLKNLHSMIERNNAVIIIDKMPTVNADSSQLSQLFQNLIDNAIKFRREETPHIHISAKQEFTIEEGSKWIFSIQDNGIGIDPKNFNKLFVIFQRLHNREEYPGTGIGLVTCKKIVMRHGGRIWIESKLGEGSTFYFTIPIIRNDSSDNNSK